MAQNNPLQQYFRQPAIYIRLPSGGNFYPDGALDMPPNGEIPVYPMTAMDEISYRTPDALFNGTATVDVIRSCVPNIRNPWVMPAMDLDTVLVSIRIATYGHSMDIDTQCPACKEESSIGVDLRMLLELMKSPDYQTPVRYRDMEIYFRPMPYSRLDENNKKQFEEQRILQAVTDPNQPEDKRLDALNQALKQITQITIEALSHSIAVIKTPTAMVTESDFIVDFLKNCDRDLFNTMRDHIVTQKNTAEIQPLKLKCNKCSNEYSQGITLNMPNFFAPAS
jgi:hypothetical protein